MTSVTHESEPTQVTEQNTPTVVTLGSKDVGKELERGKPNITRGAMTGVSLHMRMEYARVLAPSELLPKNFRDKPSNVLWAVEYGTMLGIHPMAAITNVSVIDNKPSANAALMSALVRNAGHKCRIFSRTTDDGHPVGICEIIRKDDPDFTFRSEWTVERAEMAGLLTIVRGGVTRGTEIAPGLRVFARSERGKILPWEAYTSAMLKWRAVSECARDACEEVLCGVNYTPEELGAYVDIEGDVIPGEVESSFTEAPRPPAQPAPELLDSAGYRAAVFAAFGGDDPQQWQANLTRAWEAAGGKKDRIAAMVIADEAGQMIDGVALMARAGEWMKRGEKFIDRVTSQPSDSQDTDIQDAEVVEPGPTPEEEERLYAAERERLIAEIESQAELMGQPVEEWTKRWCIAQGVPDLGVVDNDALREFLDSTSAVVAQARTRKPQEPKQPEVTQEEQANNESSPNALNQPHPFSAWEGDECWCHKPADADIHQPQSS
jgi:hypothetical protein